MKNGEEKSNNPWGTAPTRGPQDKLCLTGPSVPRQPESLRPESVRQALALRATQSAKVTWNINFQSSKSLN